MSQSFLYSARSSDYSLAVESTSYVKDERMQDLQGGKIADIIFGDKTIRKDVRFGRRD